MSMGVLESCSPGYICHPKECCRCFLLSDSAADTTTALIDMDILSFDLHSFFGGTPDATRALGSQLLGSHMFTPSESGGRPLLLAASCS